MAGSLIIPFLLPSDNFNHTAGTVYLLHRIIDSFPRIKNNKNCKIPRTKHDNEICSFYFNEENRILNKVKKIIVCQLKS